MLLNLVLMANHSQQLLIYTNITPPDLVSRGKIVGPNRTTTPIRIILWDNLLLFQLF